MVAERQQPEAVVKGNCPRCKAAWSLTVPRAGFIAWRAGTLIQNALPGLSRSEAEQLVSGTCPRCFDDMFGGPEEWDEESIEEERERDES